MNRSSLRRALAAALFLAPAPARAQTTAPDAKARALFQKPLIVGASVSSGFRAESPARKVADRFGASDAVVSLAVPGAGSASQVGQLTDARLSAATVVVGVDLFFWDTLRDCASGLSSVDELFRRLAAHETPLVVATVPALHAPLVGGNDNECRPRLNDKIAKACAADKTCALLDLDAFYAQAKRDGGVRADGKLIPTGDLFSDGLHLSDKGSALVARAIVAAVEKTPAAN